MKLCINCKHGYRWSKDTTEMVYCRHPNNGISLVDGEPKSLFASTNRSDSPLAKYCGEEGRWFEENEPEVKPQTWWELFWSRK